jgi:hypothetical protein
MKRSSMFLLAACACGGDPINGNEGEVITTVSLSFAPITGAPLTAEVDDPDGDGGLPPRVDAISLPPGTYSLTIEFLNRLETPAESITDEVRDEAEEHQVFLLGSAIVGGSPPLVHAYADRDANGLPLGLVNDITASTGSGDLEIVLRHLPPLAGGAVKVAGLAEEARANGLDAIGGDSDAAVVFPLTVQ